MGETSRFTLRVDGEELSCMRLTPSRRMGQVLVMHGAGTGNKTRYVPLMMALCDSGLDVIAFDCSGHGESTGKLAELSLERRLIQARAVLAAVRVPELRFVVMGFSMSGQTVCDLLGDDNYGPEISAAALCCPAAYSLDVHKLQFGDSNFTKGIRQPQSWLTSSSFEVLRKYPNPVLIVQSELDDIIPHEIIAQMLARRAGNPTKHVVLKGAPHKIALWLTDKPDQTRELAADVAALIAGDE